MEHNDQEIKKPKRTIIHVVFLVLLAIAIFAIIFAVVTLLKNIEEIKIDPINYAINKTSLESCTCVDQSGQTVFFGGMQDGDKKWSSLKS